MGPLLQSLDIGRYVGYPSHISRIGFHIQLQLWLEGMKFRSKGQHALGTSVHHAGASLNPVASGKDLRIMFKHAMCDALVLKFT